MAYGALPGHGTSTADAVRAYVQSLLKSMHETWVAVPIELWPAEWKKAGYKRPCCRLIKALYGHPDSGAHWEAHLTEAIIANGGKLVPTHPSTFWFPDQRLLLTVYVDDLLLSGPVAQHSRFWQRLRNGPKAIKLDDPEPLDRFLGRSHTITPL